MIGQHVVSGAKASGTQWCTHAQTHKAVCVPLHQVHVHHTLTVTYCCTLFHAFKRTLTRRRMDPNGPPPSRCLSGGRGVGLTQHVAFTNTLAGSSIQAHYRSYQSPAKFQHASFTLAPWSRGGGRCSLQRIFLLLGWRSLEFISAKHFFRCEFELRAATTPRKEKRAFNNRGSKSHVKWEKRRHQQNRNRRKNPSPTQVNMCRRTLTNKHRTGWHCCWQWRKSRHKTRTTTSPRRTDALPRLVPFLPC